MFREHVADLVAETGPEFIAVGSPRPRTRILDYRSGGISGSKGTYLPKLVSWKLAGFAHAQCSLLTRSSILKF